MTFDIERAIRASHWKANKRSFKAGPRVALDSLGRARALHASGDYRGCIALIQGQPDWQGDPSAWRLIGLSWHGLAQYEEDAARKNEMYGLTAEAHANDISLHRTEIAKAEVNMAAALITQRRYDEALEAARRARAADPGLVTPHIAILAVHVRRGAGQDVEAYLRHLQSDETWIFDDGDFRERLDNDPDLAGVSNLIAKQKEFAR